MLAAGIFCTAPLFSQVITDPVLRAGQNDTGDQATEAFIQELLAYSTETHIEAMWADGTTAQLTIGQLVQWLASVNPQSAPRVTFWRILAF